MEFIMTNVMQTAVYRIQNTKYTSHKKLTLHEPGKQVCIKMTKL
jgi:hypothetical protein